MTESTRFEQLLRAAAAEPQPQRLLFVFAQAQLPEGASAQQRKRFELGQGGALTPLACVDKAPADLSTFDALREEARNACPPWQALVIAAVSGQDGQPPSSALVDSSMHAMVEAVRVGRLGNYLILGPAGEPLQLSKASPG
ncbi:MAG: ribonucleotide reductase subunit alpha [Ramlibacter sp.]